MLISLSIYDSRFGILHRAGHQTQCNQTRSVDLSSVGRSFGPLFTESSVNRWALCRMAREGCRVNWRTIVDSSSLPCIRQHPCIFWYPSHSLRSGGVFLVQPLRGFRFLQRSAWYSGPFLHPTSVCLEELPTWCVWREETPPTPWGK